MSIHPDDPRSDAELIAAAGRREHAAFDKLYSRHKQWVYRLAFRFTGSDADAWDVHQETFLYLASKARSMTLTSPFRALLAAVICERAMKSSRKRGRGIDRSELLAALPQTAQHHDLHQKLAALDLPHRQVIVLRQVDQLNSDEIAHLLRLDVATVTSRLTEAYRSVPEALAAGLSALVPDMPPDQDGRRTELLGEAHRLVGRASLPVRLARHLAVVAALLFLAWLVWLVVS